MEEESIMEAGTQRNSHFLSCDLFVTKAVKAMTRRQVPLRRQ